MKRRLRTSAVVILALLMVGSVFTGCKSNTKAANGGGGKVTIAYQIGGNTDPYGTWLKSVITAYNKTNPKVKIVPAPITADENTYYTKLDLEMKSTSTCPDIVMEDTFLINSDAAAGYLLPIDDKVSAWSDWSGSNFIGNMKQGVTSQDKHVYGIPYNTDSRGIWYNKTLFQKAGLPADWNPKSWDDILTACAAIKSKLPDVVPFWMNSGKATGEATSMQTYEMLLYGTGERLLDGNKWIVSSPSILASLNFINSIYKNNYGPPLSQVINSQAGAIAAQQYMPKGKLAMLLDGNWVVSNWASGGAAPWPDYTTSMGFAAMPTNKGQDPGTITLAGGWAWSIPKNSKNQDAAWDFIKFISGKDNMETLDLALGNVSPRADVAQDPKYTATPFYDVATKFLETAQFRPANTQYPTVSTSIQTMVESVATGSATPEKAMATYASDVKRIVGDGNTVTK